MISLITILLEKLDIQTKQLPNAGNICAQIPGLISQIFVVEGDRVELNQKLVILEAMKMENEIDSTVIGRVSKIYFQVGDIVEKGNILMDIII